jgi:6-phosphofructokinase 1
MKNLPSYNFTPSTLGKCKVSAPETVLKRHTVRDSQQVLLHSDPEIIGSYYEQGLTPPAFETAGPRKKIYFDPSKVKAAIVTCGGLCPGINDVIRAIVMQLTYGYGVQTIYGIRYGFEGFIPAFGHKPIMLETSKVQDIHTKGGTILGTSRGQQDVKEVVDALERMNISMLFCIGGDGTLRGAHAIDEEIQKRALKIAVVGVPKTIDNDIGYVEKTFGFETAFSSAASAISSAHVEAKGARNGIGLVKLMGRHSGYIAAKAALAMNDVNIVLIPELPFKLTGDAGLFKYLEDRLQDRGHAVIVVAEGAGQELFSETETGTDASGNKRLLDIGIYLRDNIKAHFKSRDIHMNIKYIDPSYIIRSVPAVPTDSIFCGQLGQYAVHAAMGGRTDICIGLWNKIFTHLPLAQATSKRKVVSLDSELWLGVLEATGQPSF